MTPDIIRKNDADHGAAWLDFDTDGDLDLALTGAMHHLLRNDLPGDRGSGSLQVIVLDAKGRYTRAGSEIRIYDRGTKKLLGTGLLDTGSGYDSQNAMPARFGLPQATPVDVEITTMTQKGRRSIRLSDISPKDYLGRYLAVKVDQNGMIVKQT